MVKRLGLVAALVVVLRAGDAHAAPVFVNPSFETGDFTGWITSDLPNVFASFPLSVLGSSPDLVFGGADFLPTDGNFAAYSSFDSESPGTITIAQDVVMPGAGQSLWFDYRAAWLLFDSMSLDRHFRVIVEPTGGGASLLVAPIFTAPGGTANDTLYQTGSVNLSAFAGQAIRVVFALDVPEAYTGPALFELDNIRTVPEPASGLLFGMGLTLAAAVGRFRRKPSN